MLEIDCSELPGNLWFNIADEIKNDFSENPTI